MARLHLTSILSDDVADIDNEGLEPYSEKRKRIKRELIAAGITGWGLRKFNSRYLPRIIHDYEHIMGVIYGRFAEGPGLLSMVDRMVVATDRRIISLNHKPGYTDTDEFTYDIIDGVDEAEAGPFAAVTLNTKISHFTIRFVKKRCAEKFVHYIEKRRLEYFEGQR